MVVHKCHVHPKTPPVECPSCGKLSKTKDIAKRHFQFMHEQSERYRCEVCNNTFKNMYTYNIHKKSHDPTAYVYQCTDCEKKFLRKTDLTNHYDKMHTDAKYPCPKCEKVFKSKLQLSNHKYAHDPDKGSGKHQCSQCDQKFDFGKKLRFHVKMVHEKVKPHLCAVCGKTFKHAYELKQHASKHDGVRLYSCQVCEKKFPTSCALRCHRVVHSKEKPYVCEFCGKAFSQYMTRTRHVRTVHENNTPFGCTICDKKFVYKSQVNSHMKTHGVMKNSE